MSCISDFQHKQVHSRTKRTGVSSHQDSTTCSGDSGHSVGRRQERRECRCQLLHPVEGGKPTHVLRKGYRPRLPPLSLNVFLVCWSAYAVHAVFGSTAGHGNPDTASAPEPPKTDVQAGSQKAQLRTTPSFPHLTSRHLTLLVADIFPQALIRLEGTTPVTHPLWSVPLRRYAVVNDKSIPLFVTGERCRPHPTCSTAEAHPFVCVPPPRFYGHTTTAMLEIE